MSGGLLDFLAGMVHAGLVQNKSGNAPVGIRDKSDLRIDNLQEEFRGWRRSLMFAVCDQRS